MTSIIKVDTVQDIDGNNIISENANTITIGASGDTISIPAGATLVNSGTATGFGLTTQSVQTTGFTAVKGNLYPCNTTSAAFTVTLPASASVGDQIGIVDYAGTSDTNFITINPNGNKIESSTANFTLTNKRSGVILTFIDSTQGWLATSGINEGEDALSLSTAVSIDFLVVAGGGGGGRTSGGGGGAGGFRTSTQSVTGGTLITVSVGSGGAGSVTSSTAGSNGSSSSISGTGITTISSAGGGGGGSTTSAGANGGSGGGASQGSGTGGTGNTPSTSPSQGNNGGIWVSPSSYAGAGGGGAGAVGTSVSAANDDGGNGGNGSASSITGTSVTYAGGGGGGTFGNIGAPGGTGGTGGGGIGLTIGFANPFTFGQPNTGGGGGGGSHTGVIGFQGGSGIVIISVPTSRFTNTITGSPTITTSGSNTIMQFTGSGSYKA
jgi:hypothetical protein